MPQLGPYKYEPQDLSKGLLPIPCSQAFLQGARQIHLGLLLHIFILLLFCHKFLFKQSFLKRSPAKWRCKCVLCRFSRVQVFAIPWLCSPPGSSVHGMLQKEYWGELPVLLQSTFLTQRSSGTPEQQVDSLLLRQRGSQGPPVFTSLLIQGERKYLNSFWWITIPETGQKATC